MLQFRINSFPNPVQSYFDIAFAQSSDFRNPGDGMTLQIKQGHQHPVSFRSFLHCMADYGFLLRLIQPGYFVFHLLIRYPARNLFFQINELHFFLP